MLLLLALSHSRCTAPPPLPPSSTPPTPPSYLQQRKGAVFRRASQLQACGAAPGVPRREETRWRFHNFGSGNEGLSVAATTTQSRRGSARQRLAPHIRPLRLHRGRVLAAAGLHGGGYSRLVAGCCATARLCLDHPVVLENKTASFPRSHLATGVSSGVVLDSSDAVERGRRPPAAAVAAGAPRAPIRGHENSDQSRRSEGAIQQPSSTSGPASMPAPLGPGH